MTPELRRRLDWALTVYRNSRVQHEATIHNILVECNDALSALPPPGQECQSTERHIDEILHIATQDMTAAFGDSAEQYRREAIKAVLAAENWAGVCYERRRTAGQEWRDISSAPKDGPSIDLWIRSRSSGATQRYIDAAWAGGWCSTLDNTRLGEYPFSDYEATHWMPFFAPPVAEPKETP
jgi:hypothetical protein